MNKNAFRIVQTLFDHGFEAVYAGGCVRDFLLGLEPHDIDIATSATPQEIERLFPKTIPVGAAFGVMIVVIEDEEFEVATFRSDSTYSDGRHPDSVKFSSIEEDAKRRDLTINGMFFDPIIQKVIDFVDGQRDLKNKVIRFIGDPNKRIEEDKLRLLRAIRFSAKFDFEIDEQSFAAIKFYAHAINQVSCERIADELTKLLQVSHKRKAIELLFSSELVQYVLPEIILMKGCEQPVDYHPEGDVFAHTLMALENLENDVSPELLWATLLHDIGKPVTQTFEDRIRFNCHDVEGAKITESILKRLKFSNEFIEHTVSMVASHMKFMHVKDMRASRLKRFMNMPKFEEHLALHRSDCMSSHEGLDNYHFLVEKLKTFEAEPEKNVIAKLPRLVTGHDLIAMGYKQGPMFRTILTDIEDQQLEEKLADRESALSYIKENYAL